MLKSFRKLFSEVRCYHSSNSLVNYLLLLAIAIIALVQVSQTMPVLFGWHAASVNFYLDVLLNLSIGYVVSTIFYILVVYYPHRKRVRLVKARTYIIFARLQGRLSSIANLIVSSVNLSVDTSQGVPKSYNEILQEVDLFGLLQDKEVIDPWGSQNALDQIIRDSLDILSYKLILVHFLAFMDTDELKLYADLEEIFIFENMDKLDRWPPKDELLAHEFKYIVDAYNDCQNVLGTTKYPVVWEATEP